MKFAFVRSLVLMRLQNCRIFTLSLIFAVLDWILFLYLTAKYYSTAITEIGLALFATCVILNFYYKQDTMPNWLKLFMFRILGRLVLIKYEFKVKKKKKRNRKELLIEENCELPELTGNKYSGPYDVGKMSTINENNCEENGSYTDPEQRPPVQRKRTRTRSLIRAETPLLSDREANSHHHEHCILEPDHEKQDDELNKNRADWQMAAKILDRLVLVLGIVISIATFLAIFLQAPRVRAIFFWRIACSALGWQQGWYYVEKLTLQRLALGGQRWTRPSKITAVPTIVSFNSYQNSTVWHMSHSVDGPVLQITYYREP